MKKSVSLDPRPPTHTPGLRGPSVHCQLSPTSQSGGKATAIGILKGSLWNPLSMRMRGGQEYSL